MSTAMAVLVAGLVFSAGDSPALAQESVIVGGRGLPGGEVGVRL